MIMFCLLLKNSAIATKREMTPNEIPTYYDSVIKNVTVDFVIENLK